MIVMTTGLTGLMALMRQDEKPVERGPAPDAYRPSSLRPNTTTVCRSRPSRS
jgi:hypothetical protein